MCLALRKKFVSSCTGPICSSGGQYRGWFCLARRGWYAAPGAGGQNASLSRWWLVVVYVSTWWWLHPVITTHANNTRHLVSILLIEFFMASAQIPASAEVLVEIAELILVHPAHHLFEYLCFRYDACLFEKLHLLKPVHSGVWFWFNRIIRALSYAAFNCAHLIPFFLMMLIALVTACSMLLLRPCMRLKSSQLTRGVGSCSHACLRLLCFVWSVMI